MPLCLALFLIKQPNRPSFGFRPLPFLKGKRNFCQFGIINIFFFLYFRFLSLGSQVWVLAPGCMVTRVWCVQGLFGPAGPALPSVLSCGFTRPPQPASTLALCQFSAPFLWTIYLLPYHHKKSKCPKSKCSPRSVLISPCNFFIMWVVLLTSYISKN